MPTIRLGKVRRLLKDGKAKIVKHHPFTIQLLYDSKTNTQPIEICEDVGYNYIGISVKSESHEYVSAQYDTLQDEKACHDSCRKLRRSRRNRLRYRKPRFDNRKRGEGWLAPSLKHKKELNVNVVKMYCAVMPITHATVEVGSFDTMLLRKANQNRKVQTTRKVPAITWQLCVRQCSTVIITPAKFVDAKSRMVPFYICTTCSTGKEDTATSLMSWLQRVKNATRQQIIKKVASSTDLAKIKNLPIFQVQHL